MNVNPNVLECFHWGSLTDTWVFLGLDISRIFQKCLCRLGASLNLNNFKHLHTIIEGSISKSAFGPNSYSFQWELGGAKSTLAMKVTT